MNTLIFSEYPPLSTVPHLSFVNALQEVSFSSSLLEHSHRKGMSCEHGQHISSLELLMGGGRANGKSPQRQMLCGPPPGHLCFVFVVEHQVVLLAPGLQPLVLPLNLWLSLFLKIIFWGMKSRALVQSIIFIVFLIISFLKFLMKKRNELAEHSKYNTLCRETVPLTVASQLLPCLFAAPWSFFLIYFLFIYEGMGVKRGRERERERTLSMFHV